MDYPSNLPTMRPALLGSRYQAAVVAWLVNCERRRERLSRWTERALSAVIYFVVGAAGTLLAAATILD